MCNKFYLFVYKFFCLQLQPHVTRRGIIHRVQACAVIVESEMAKKLNLSGQTLNRVNDRVREKFGGWVGGDVCW